MHTGTDAYALASLKAVTTGSPAAGVTHTAMPTTIALLPSSAVLALEAGHRLHGAGVLPHWCQDAHDVVWNDIHSAPCIVSSESAGLKSHQHCLHSCSAACHLILIGFHDCRGSTAEAILLRCMIESLMIRYRLASACT